MAIYHANLSNYSRGKGHSAVAGAAYRAGLKLTDQRTGLVHDYTHRRGVAAWTIITPADAPEWAHDPAQLWAQVEQGETRANARVARDIEVALPAELSPAQREALAGDLGRMLVERYQVGALVAIHTPSRSGDARNHHTHILLTPRTLGADGFGARSMAEFDARQGAGAEALRSLRAVIADRINAHLAHASVAVRVDPRPLAEQARIAERAGDTVEAVRLSRRPTRHEGKQATHAKRSGQVPDPAGPVAGNDAIRRQNAVFFWDWLKQAEAWIVRRTATVRRRLADALPRQPGPEPPEVPEPRYRPSWHP